MEKINLTGQAFGKLTVLETSNLTTDEPLWHCQCECGKEILVSQSQLLENEVADCGCSSMAKRRKEIAGLCSGEVTAVMATTLKRKDSILWLCRCSCGKEFLTEGYKITNKTIKSCGCARGKSRIKDLSGQRFGRLTAIRRLEEKVGTSYAWLCRCDCGKETKVSAHALLSGGTKSCGCGKIEALRNQKKDITNQRFGKLVAIRPTEKRISKSVVWLCRCDCGRMSEVSCSSLMSGNTKSCGCLPYEHESPGKYLHYVEDTCIEMLEYQGIRKNNTSGYTGVIAYRGKWRAQITFKKRNYSLGVYESKEEAVRVRKEAEEKIFGEFLKWYHEEIEARKPVKG